MEFVVYLVRLIHIFFAIFWVGTTLFMVLFLEPTIRALGPDGGKVMRQLLGGTRFTLAIAAAGWLVVLSGLVMYLPATGFNVAVMFSQRLPLTIGSIAGIAAGVIGTTIQGRASAKLQALGQQIAAQGGPPKAMQTSEMQKLQATIRQGSVWTAVLMVIAVLGMTW
ncbi:MAG: hypothetical protein H3C34_18640 [Caldilineaceae bacterium]|nr:hypothetical protein [Caldilineaceae bacterium]